MEPQALSRVVTALLDAAGTRSALTEVRALPAGGNNRVYRVRAGGDEFAAKEYFHDGGDTRDRLGTEHGFLLHAWKHGVRAVPRPLSADREAHVALYEFVSGRRLSAEEIAESHVLAAARLFAALNSAESRAAAAALPIAADACLSVAEEVHSVDRRVRRLADRIESLEPDARELVSDLSERWSRERTQILRAFPDAESPVRERSLSPSDFGFHNALLRPDGELCFIDFEYAGWDDPAKMAGDFFWHAGMRPPRRYFDRFIEIAFRPFDRPAEIARRTRKLSAAFRMRWTCIALNEFLPEAAQRRRFAGGEAAAAGERRREQLAKARALLAEPDL